MILHRLKNVCAACHAYKNVYAPAVEDARKRPQRPQPLQRPVQHNRPSYNAPPNTTAPPTTARPAHRNRPSYSGPSSARNRPFSILAMRFANDNVEKDSFTFSLLGLMVANNRILLQLCVSTSESRYWGVGEKVEKIYATSCCREHGSE